MSLTNEQISSAIFLLRMILAVIFFAHGAQKVMGWFGGYGLAGTSGFMKSLHIPAPFAYAASFTEFLGSIAIFLGLLTRIAAAGIFINMLVAIVTVHLPAGFFNNPPQNKGTGFEFPLTLAVLALALVITGGGSFSLDAILSLPLK